jgi:hypothetical protein
MPEKTSQTINRTGGLGAWWCEVMHDSTMWPIHGEYRCGTCGRSYPVPWAPENLVQAPASIAAPSFRPAVLPMIVMLALLPVSVARAADTPIVDANTLSGTAFARYISGLDQAHPWGLETVEIDASLPKLKKRGSVRAVRRLLAFGKPQYRVLESAGDETVKQRVIVRYLSAEVQAAQMPASAVAITPANYKFHYKGAVKTPQNVAYIFQITPRTKREGLIRGELWLDGDSGAVVRQSGRFVKSPSLFVKRIDVIREIELQNGTPQARLTHLTVNARFVGTAELTILERPYEIPVAGSPGGPAER